MKKIVFYITTLFFLMATTLYASETETADVYEPVATPIPLPQKKKPSVLSKLFSKNIPESIKMTESSVFRYNHFETKVRQEDTDIMYYPQTNEISIAFETRKKRFLIFDTQMQKALQQAFATYESEFENKTLEDRKKRNAKKYGKLKTLYRIDALIGLEEYEPEITMGYVFVDKSPYFIITIPETYSRNVNPVELERTKKSAPIKLLFNRNQMHTLLQQCSEEAIALAMQNATASAESASEAAAETDPLAADDETTPVTDEK